MSETTVFGYGLVTGLKRTGDSIRNIATVRTLAKRLQGQYHAYVNQMRSRNVAAVMVTANIPASARPGQKIDIIVSSAGDANSEGGVLQLTPLQASMVTPCCPGPSCPRWILCQLKGFDPKSPQQGVFRWVPLWNVRIQIDWIYKI